jgi:hypothetical protein
LFSGRLLSLGPLQELRADESLSAREEAGTGLLASPGRLVRRGKVQAYLGGRQMDLES